MITEIENRTTELNDLIALWEPAEAAQPRQRLAQAKPSGLTDAEVVKKAAKAANGAKFNHLFYSGDISDYGSDESRADLALCNILAFWTGGDAYQMERIFDQSKLGGRDKWRKRGDYRARTVAAALANVREYYSPMPEDEILVALAQAETELTDLAIDEPTSELNDGRSLEIKRLRHEIERLRLVLEIRDNPSLRQEARALISICEMLCKLSALGRQDEEGFVQLSYKTATLHLGAKGLKVAQSTLGRHARKGADVGLYEIRHTPVLLPEGSSRPMWIKTSFRPASDNLIDLLRLLASYEGPQMWGGRRIWRCPDHPTAKIDTKVSHFCKECGKAAVCVDASTGEVLKS